MLIASAPPALAGKLEIRGLGIVELAAARRGSAAACRAADARCRNRAPAGPRALPHGDPRNRHSAGADRPRKPLCAGPHPGCAGPFRAGVNACCIAFGLEALCATLNGEIAEFHCHHDRTRPGHPWPPGGRVPFGAGACGGAASGRSRPSPSALTTAWRTAAPTSPMRWRG